MDQGVGMQSDVPVAERSATHLERSVEVSRVARRRVLLLAPAAVCSLALAACVSKEAPNDVTPYTFPAVGAGQKDTAQFGARSGPTVP